MKTDPGRLWFDRFVKAFHESDLETIWSLQTRASHALILLRMQEAIDRANRDPAFQRTLAERMGPDIRALDPRAAWEAYTLASCAHVAAGHMTWGYLDERREDDRLLVRMRPVAGSRPLPPGLGELIQVLVEEDGELRLDKPLSEALAGEE